MAEATLRTDTLWTVDTDQPRYVWVGCSVNPGPGHARPVYPAQTDEPLVCPVCREPQHPLSKTAIKRYKSGDRSCGACRRGDHVACTGVECYGCPPELHRRTGVLATRTPGPKW